MRTNKLVASMVATLTALFVTLGFTAFNAYESVQTVMGGGIGSGVPITNLLLLFAPIVIAVLVVVTIVLAIVGAVKANRNPQKKGLFVTIAVFQLLLFLLMGAYGGYYGYLYASYFGIQLVVYVLAPYVVAALVLLVAFIQTCRGVKGPKQVAAAPVEVAEQAPRQNSPFPPPPPPRG